MNYLDTGFNARMEVLQGEINNHIKPLLDGHGWTWEIESTHKEGDGFLIIKVEKNSVIKRFGIIYGQQVSKSIYSYIQRVRKFHLLNLGHMGFAVFLVICSK